MSLKQNNNLWKTTDPDIRNERSDIITAIVMHLIRLGPKDGFGNKLRDAFIERAKIYEDILFSKASSKEEYTRKDNLEEKIHYATKYYLVRIQVQRAKLAQEKKKEEEEIEDFIVTKKAQFLMWEVDHAMKCMTDSACSSSCKYIDCPGVRKAVEHVTLECKHGKCQRKGCSLLSSIFVHIACCKKPYSECDICCVRSNPEYEASIPKEKFRL